MNTLTSLKALLKTSKIISIKDPCTLKFLEERTFNSKITSQNFHYVLEIIVMLFVDLNTKLKVKVQKLNFHTTKNPSHSNIFREKIRSLFFHLAAINILEMKKMFVHEMQ